MSPLDPTRMLDEIKSWVAIESPTGAAAEVSRLMALVGRQFAAIGFDVRTVPGRNGYGDNLLIQTPWGGDGPGILVLAHLDTVHPLGTLEQHAALPRRGRPRLRARHLRHEGRRLLSLAAARVLAERGTPTPLPIPWVIGADEEVGSPTSRSLIEAAGLRARHVLVTEPARDGGRCVTARKGTARYTIRFHGRPAHSGTRHADGRSAIKEMAHQILALEAMTDHARGVTANVGVVSGGTTFNVVPEHASLLLDIRLPDAEAAKEAVALVEGLRPVDPDVRIDIEGGLVAPALYEDAGDSGAPRPGPAAGPGDRLRAFGRRQRRRQRRQLPRGPAAGAGRAGRRWRRRPHPARAPLDLLAGAARHPAAQAVRDAPLRTIWPAG